MTTTTAGPRITAEPTRSATAASRTVLYALLLRDLVVLWKHKLEFVLRTIIQPFLLVFVFLYVFPTIGQGIGAAGGANRSVAESAFATVLVPGVVAISIMFQGVQSVALALAQEFGYTREIEDRVQAPCPIWLVAVAKILSGAVQGLISAVIVFPKIGQSVGGSGRGSSAFATILVPGVVGISIMFQGVQSVALQMSQEFGFTREIEDRVQAPCPVWLVAVSKVLAGTVQGIIAAVIVFPIAAVVHAGGVHAQFDVHWWVVLTLLPITCVAFSAMGLVLGCVFEPRNIGLMFGFIVLPITFLGGTYYQWTRLASVKVGAFPWLQTLVCINPLIYVNEGLRAGLTDFSHMHLYVVYPVLLGFCTAFLTIGIRAFRRRVLA